MAYTPDDGIVHKRPDKGPASAVGDISHPAKSFEVDVFEVDIDVDEEWYL